MDSKSVGKTIHKNAKRVITESGLGSSRAGNKELSHLATRLSKQLISSLEMAQQFGERLGEKIVELSKASNKQHLDQGVVRTLVLTKAVPSLADLPAETGLTNTASGSKQVGKASAPAQPAPAESVQPVVLPADEPEIEDGTPDTSVELIEEDVKAPAVPIEAVTAVEEEEEDEEDEENEDEDEEEEEEEEEEKTAVEALATSGEPVLEEDEADAIASETIDETLAEDAVDSEVEPVVSNS